MEVNPFTPDKRSYAWMEWRIRHGHLQRTPSPERKWRPADSAPSMEPATSSVSGGPTSAPPGALPKGTSPKAPVAVKSAPNAEENAGDEDKDPQPTPDSAKAAKGPEGSGGPTPAPPGTSPVEAAPKAEQTAEPQGSGGPTPAPPGATPAKAVPKAKEGTERTPSSP